jgi:hypothetical protein
LFPAHRARNILSLESTLEAIDPSINSPQRVWLIGGVPFLGCISRRIVVFGLIGPLSPERALPVVSGI